MLQERNIAYAVDVSQLILHQELLLINLSGPMRNCYSNIFTIDSTAFGPRSMNLQECDSALQAAREMNLCNRISKQ
ncbi:hypothetical protein JHK82_040014 [Glycine max]|uniref:Uncharacterized protein n=1 Tax=Glycine max TaxID=3847 RepID=A0A0R0GE13_SOYBN|nr:hypothetical protein JHK87_040025 [Glycine soja]KAG4963343.1 hypothetical protein JHK86_040211 [Glycine max]KAG5110791.1 hypothetical protein JHK82_040014 [Glycine max]KAG5122086.1 hypothetical protein JHK84_040426 [Glycine max]KAH1094692.1 hypothetical protein GYH30_040122 [Glycine max]